MSGTTFHATRLLTRTHSPNLMLLATVKRTGGTLSVTSTVYSGESYVSSNTGSDDAQLTTDMIVALSGTSTWTTVVSPFGSIL